MKAIILAAGKWTRLEPITLETPKAMVEVYGKTLLQYNMERLLPYVDEFIIVVKYKKEIIMDFFWESFEWKKVSYHEQGEQKWTWAAVLGIEAQWDIVIAYADAIFSQTDIDNVMQHDGYAVLAKKVHNPEKYWIFKLDTQGYILEVVEKPQKYIWDIANFSFFKANHSLLEFVKLIDLSPRWELEITDAVNLFVKENKMKAIILQNEFLDITSVADLEAANTLVKPELWKTQYLENIWEYEMHLWIPKTGVQEIIDYSLDETDVALREWTSDWKKRFISVENLTAWYNDEDRYPFTLLSSEWVVAGLWWWRPAKLPNITEILNQDTYDTLLKNSDNIHTSGIRIYPFARGERLASPFMKACERFYSSLFNTIYMSDDIGAENIPSQKAFERLWYKKVWYGKNVNNSPDSGKQRFVYMKKF